MKIARLELENVKRVKAVEMVPASSGLTVIGGKNGQGKTSVLDAIAWALGGDKYRPSSAQRDDSVLPPRLHVVMDNGIVVDRDGKNSSLKVTDPTGKRAGQALLDTFIEKLALDLPKFMSQTNKEKASTLLRVIGVEDKVLELENQELSIYNRRHAIGQIGDQKSKYANELPSYPDAPEEIVSASELISRQQEILLKNADNQRKRAMVGQYEAMLKAKQAEIEMMQERIKDLQAQLVKLESDEEDIGNQLEAATEASAQLKDESVSELEESIQNIDTINAKVRANMEKEKALEEANEIQRQYDQLTADLDKVREEKRNLLSDAHLPLPELTVEKGELLYRGKAWDCMSGSEQMIVAVAIVRALKPACGFVLLDKTEQMDIDTLNEFGEWLEKEGIQAICTRVSTGGECEIIIEDGVSHAVAEQCQVKKAWKEGEF